MYRSYRIVFGLALVLVLLVGAGAVAVSAQGPSGTPTPVQAPPVSASGRNLDDPAAALTLGNAVSSIAANSAEWFRFDYDTQGNTVPRPMVTIRMLNGFQNGLNFEVWSPERLQGNWWENQPVGRGTQEVLPDCTFTAPDGTTSKCTTNDLTWLGGFGAPGTYFVRIVNNTNSAIAPQLVVSGAGLAVCQSANPPANVAQPPAGDKNQGYTLVQCQDPTPDQLQGLGRTGNGIPASSSGSSVAPNSSSLQTGTDTPTPTTAAPSQAPTTSSSNPSATSMPSPAATSSSSSPTEAMTPATSSTPAGTGTPAAAPSLPANTTPTGGSSAMPGLTGLAVSQNTMLGPILTDSQGRTLYAFAKDTSSTSNCTGSCAQTWLPALASNNPQAMTGVTSSMIGSISRSDGGTQVTYNGHPLYYYSGDKNTGDTKGQGFAGVWFTVSPSGDLNQNAGSGAPSSSGTPSTSGTPSGAATPSSSMPSGTETPSGSDTATPTP